MNKNISNGMLFKDKPLTGPITIGVLVVLLIGQFVCFSFLRNPVTLEEMALTSSSSFPSNSIAVLPFANLSEEKDNQYFSDGVMEAILNNLSMIRDLKAYELLLQILHRDRVSEIDFLEQIDACDKAMVLDSDFDSYYLVYPFKHRYGYAKMMS